MKSKEEIEMKLMEVREGGKLPLKTNPKAFQHHREGVLAALAWVLDEEAGRIGKEEK